MKYVTSVVVSSHPGDAVRVIKQRLWCCCDGTGIVVFDRELQHQRAVPASDMGKLQDVAEMSNGDVIIAASNGLYHTDATGQCHHLRHMRDQPMIVDT